MPLFPPKSMHSTLRSCPDFRHACEWARETTARGNPSYKADALKIPSRLIDVGSEKLRVVDTSILRTPEEEPVGLAALSYVWGTNQTFILLQRNKGELMTSFDIAQLPQTIQDAIAVTREIGLRYIWVDALCIMQDSSEDKAQELPKMRQIYQRAAITIIAAIAKSATEGFLHVAEHSTYLIDPIEIPYPAIQRGYQRWKDPINDRCWTFQELLLSTRLILFSYRGVETIDRENIPSADGLTSGKDPQLPNVPWNGRMFTLKADMDNIRQVWLSIRGKYSRRQLTYAGDKLVAIAAVAEEIGRSYNCRYLAGIWERDLIKDLKWVHSSTYSPKDDEEGYDPEPSRKPRPKGYVAPSWSWASIDGPVDNHDVKGDPRQVPVRPTASLLSMKDIWSLRSARASAMR